MTDSVNTKIYHATLPRSQSIGTAIPSNVGSAGSFTSRVPRNELRGYRRWGYPGAFAVPVALLWADAALVDAVDADDLADLAAVEEDLWKL